jgi:hypothetical protein
MDQKALAAARQAQERLIEAEQQNLTRLSGQAAVLLAGDRRQAQKTRLACTFCGRSQREVRKLIAGPGAYICDGCVELARRVVSSGSAAGTPLGRIHPVLEQDGGTRCRFCGKRRDEVANMAAMPAESGATFAGPAAICVECLSLCNEIIVEELA